MNLVKFGKLMVMDLVGSFCCLNIVVGLCRYEKFNVTAFECGADETNKNINSSPFLRHITGWNKHGAESQYISRFNGEIKTREEVDRWLRSRLHLHGPVVGVIRQRRAAT